MFVAHPRAFVCRRLNDPSRSDRRLSRPCAFLNACLPGGVVAGTEVHVRLVLIVCTTAQLDVGGRRLAPIAVRLDMVELK
jgi:hypothetical protein